MAKPVLDLGALVECPIVRIGDEEYEMLAPGMLTVLEFYRIGKQADRARELAEGEMGEPEVIELQKLLADIVGFLLHAPENVLEKLTQFQRLQIVATFSRLQQEVTAPAGAKTGTPSEPQ